MADASKTAAALVSALGSPMSGAGASAKKPPDATDTDDSESEDDLAGSVLESAAGGVMSALESGDVAAFAKALRAAVKACGNCSDEED